MNKQSRERKLTDKVYNIEALAILAIILIGAPAGGLLYAHFGLSESLQRIFLIVIAIALVIKFFKIMLSPINRFID